MKHTRISLICALVLTLTIQACRPNAAAVSTPTHGAASATAATPPQTPRITPIPFGSGVTVDRMKFVITGSIRPADGLVSAGDIFNAQPREYQQYVFVTVAVTCEAPADQQCHLDLFKLKLSVSNNVFKYPQWYISGVDSILKEPDFPGGATVSGNVPFIVSVGDSGLKLVYEALSGESYYLALP